MPWTDFWLKVPFLKTSSRETAFFCADTVRALQINNTKVNRNNRLITYHFLAAKYTENMEKGKASLSHCSPIAPVSIRHPLPVDTSSFRQKPRKRRIISRHHLTCLK